MQNKNEIIFAAGCFWGVQHILRSIPGVLSTEVGYIGGKPEQASYEHVKTGHTEHAESVRVTFDTSKTTIEELINVFFRLHDPTTLNRQENDIGFQYRSAIFYNTEEQKTIAEDIKNKLEKSKKWNSPIVTMICRSERFFKAEDYHQDYLLKNPTGYNCHWLRK
jgi:methionine-S-sulfoxide reductase